MFEQILSQLQGQAVPELISKFGLDPKQANSSVHAAADSVKEVVGGGDGFGLDDVLNLFSNAQNSSAADGILSNIGSVLQGKLTGDVGLNASTAGGVKDMILPLLTNMLSKHIGGDQNNLQSLFGNLGGNGLADMAKGMLGKLFN
ncbi:MAG TPA: hypothetical protein VHL57_10665 [Flavobacteriales bacterium]|jgi:hypothetical protein|nr:hypothetical protein [Flavobacteriales bacterium]